MPDSALTRKRIDVATDYFRKIDSGDPTIVDIMTDDVEVYFPKFGVGYGKAEFMELAKGLMGSLQSIQHDLDRMTFHVAGDHVIVEGFESGVMADGAPWPVEGRSEGRFANFFRFEGDLIKRVYVYVDPDFASAHKERFLWGDHVRMAKA
ncbi:nuclear transport factor 2 family protein [Methylocystis sp. 9N]|uniref:Nuclear transport factor 2 family protein n=1 Tax=Methylocystis borbori TaxID=3118750 RepID=A0ABU7XJZ5_9HYPH